MAISLHHSSASGHPSSHHHHHGESNVRSLSSIASTRLMQHDTRMLQSIPFPFGACRQQQRPHRRRLPHTNRANRRANILHGVIDRQSSGDRASGGVDVHVDLLLGGLSLEEEELRDDGRTEAVVDWTVEAYYPLLQQTRVDVVCEVSAGAYGREANGGGSYRCASRQRRIRVLGVWGRTNPGSEMWRRTRARRKRAG